MTMKERPMGEEGSSSESTQEDRHLVSDTTVFKYCLGDSPDRASLLKDIVAASASDQMLSSFAHHVALYSGCSHHRRQVIIAKSLIEDGTRVWNSIARSNRLLQWDEAVLEIGRQFESIARCSARSLTKKDFELLKCIAGCGEYMAQENFEKMWCWLYPITVTLSSDILNKAWSSVSPKWIEGFITKEEAEMSLQGPLGMQVPGTFILRFPTSRSWPHPDAGNLVVTYVGHDYTIHHRLLSLDYIFSSNGREKNAKTLEEMLLEDPALLGLGRQDRPSFLIVPFFSFALQKAVFRIGPLSVQQFLLSIKMQDNKKSIIVKASCLKFLTLTSWF